MFVRLAKFFVYVILVALLYKSRHKIIGFFTYELGWCFYKSVGTTFSQNTFVYDKEETLGQVSLNKPMVIRQSALFPGIFFTASFEGKIIKVDTNSNSVGECILNFESKIESKNYNGLYNFTFHPKDSVIALAYTIPSKNKFSRKRQIISLVSIKNKRVDSNSEQILYKIPTIEHCGGGLEFDFSGHLFIALGDGELEDLENRVQNLEQPYGKILRLKVDKYQISIPTTNPFYTTKKSLKEIWALGLRNPFRMTFGQDSTSLIVGDVGHNKIEEINYLTIGANCGWSVKEGKNIFKKDAVMKKFTEPIYQYEHGIEGFSVTGGIIYRGNKFPELKHKYIFGDYITGRIWYLDLNNLKQKPILLLKNAGGITSFFASANGNIFWTDFANNKIYKLTKKTK